MESNPYQSPEADERAIPNSNRPGILSWLIVIALLPTPLIGGVAGLAVGLKIGFRFFEAPPRPPLPDLTETGWWVVLACGALGFAITGTVVGFTIRRLLNPVTAA